MTKHNVHIQMPTILYNKIKEIAEEQGNSVSVCIRTIIVEHIKKNGKDNV